MPITDTLKNAEEFRQAGFTDPQAKLLAAKFEETAQLITQDLKTALHAEISGLRVEMLEAFKLLEAKLDARFEAIDSKFEAIDSKFEAIDSKFASMEAKFDAKIEKLRVELHSELRKQTLTFVSVLIAALTLAVAVIKVFPNWL
jgi:chromosome segregation ATPase